MRRTIGQGFEKYGLYLLDASSPVASLVQRVLQDCVDQISAVVCITYVLHVYYICTTSTGSYINTLIQQLH